MRFTNQIWVQDSEKKHQIIVKLHTMIVGNKIIVDCLTLKLSLTGLEIHHKSFEWIWKPIVIENPKISKLASNPPRWANIVPNLSKWPQIDEVACMMCAGSIITPWKVCV